MATLNSVESAALDQKIQALFLADTFKQKGISEGFDVNTPFTPEEFERFSNGFIRNAIDEIKQRFDQFPSWDAQKKAALIETASSKLSDQLRSTCTITTSNPLYYPTSGLLSKIVSWIWGK